MLFQIRSIQYIPSTIPLLRPSENIAFNKIPIKLHLLFHYDKASLIWVLLAEDDKMSGLSIYLESEP